MGYTTDFIGCVDVRPPLNHAEQQYLSAFTASRRFDRVDGAYAVPGNPAAEAVAPIGPVDRYNWVAACRRNTHDLSLIKVTANVVREEILWGPSGALATSLAGGVLPYEDIIDTWDARRER